MLTKLKLKDKYAVRVGNKQSRTFTFHPGVNLLVGPNGSGKSTVLRALKDVGSPHASSRKAVAKYVEHTIDEHVTLKYFDFESQNPRTLSHFVDTAFAFQVASKFQSHGEVNRLLGDGLFKAEHISGCLVLLDEPDQALDFLGARKLADMLASLPAKQAIVSVHHPVIVLDPRFHVIEMRPGYLEDMRHELRSLVNAGSAWPKNAPLDQLHPQD
jgi:predicted ATPase